MSSDLRRHTLPRSVRLRSKRAFERIFRRRCRVSNRYIVLYGCRNEEGIARLGIAVGRRFGPAVARNRIKRLIREAFRQVRHGLPQGVDWVVVPKPGPEPSKQTLQEALTVLAKVLQEKLDWKADA